MKIARLLFLFLLFSLLAACNTPASVSPTPAASPSLPPSATATASNTPEPTATFTASPTFTPTIMPTIEPLIATAKTSVTFRSEPRKGAQNLGGVYGNQTVKVIARNDAATWYYILAPEAKGGHAWVLASAFDLKGDLTRLPIALVLEKDQPPYMLPPIIHEITGTPQPVNPPAPGAKAATIIQLANVRVGPGIGYMGIGTLEPGLKVTLTGRIQGNGWLQIEYPSGPNARGWILGQLVRFEGEYAGLPFYNLLGTEIPKDGGQPAAPAQPATLAVTPGGPAGSTSTPPPPAATATPERPYGLTTAQINARSGPASSFQAYGLIEANQRVILTGQTLNGVWLQIEYPSAPNGVAWVAAEYIKIMSDIRSLPYFDNNGNPLPKP